MRPHLDPTGAARARVVPGGAGSSGAPAFPRDLAERVAACDLDEHDLYLAWELVRCVPNLSPAEERAATVLVLATLENQRQGSTRLPLESDGGRRLRALAEGLAPGSADAVLALAVDPRLGVIVGDPLEYRPLVREDGYLYHHRMRHCEAQLAEALRPRLAEVLRARPARPAPAPAPAPLAADVDAALSAEQRLAVRAALEAPLTVITGGPGTGKTFVIVAILRALARRGVPPESMALAAPTGKGAKRMHDSIRRRLAGLEDETDRRLAAAVEPCTLHRLLSYSPAADRFRHHEHNRLAQAVVIVDECSMVDLRLMERLVRATRDQARLVLLGDADQLPSVDAGAVFRDLVAVSDPVRLTHSFRLEDGGPELAAETPGRGILEVAAAINAGRAVEAVPATVRSAPAEVAFAGVELLADENGAGLGPFLERWLRDQVLGPPGIPGLLRHRYLLGTDGFGAADRERLERLFAHDERHRVLCVTRGDFRPTGAGAVNARLAALLGVELQREARAARADLAPGEPVMVQRNDYERGLFNGDQGLVLWVATESRGQRPMVVFRRGPGDFAAFQLEPLGRHLARAFALTVHKAQGSEFDHVAVLLPEARLPLLTREILYTAVSRARRSVTLVGRRELLEEAVRTRIERSSGLAARLG